MVLPSCLVVSSTIAMEELSILYDIARLLFFFLKEKPADEFVM